MGHSLKLDPDGLPTYLKKHDEPAKPEGSAVTPWPRHLDLTWLAQVEIYGHWRRVANQINRLSAHRIRSIATVFSVWLLLCAGMAHATVTLSDHESSDSMVLSLSGTITKADLQDFDKAMQSLRRTGRRLHMNAIELNSSGGGETSSQDLGRRIRKAGLNTLVRPDAICHSACINILVAGLTRMPYGQIGIHRFATYEDKVPNEKLVKARRRIQLAAELYLEEMRVSTALLAAAQGYPVWSLRVLTTEELRDLDISGTDPVEEEKIYRRYARKAGKTVGDFLWVAKRNWEECSKRQEALEITAYDCVGQKLMGQ